MLKNSVEERNEPLETYQHERYDRLQSMLSASTFESTTTIFRKLAGKIYGKTFLPSALIYSVIVLNFQVLIPRLFLTSRPNDTRFQILEAGIVLLLMVMTSVPVLIIGLSSILNTVTHHVVAHFNQRSAAPQEIENRCDQTGFEMFKLCSRILFRISIWPVSAAIFFGATSLVSGESNASMIIYPLSAIFVVISLIMPLVYFLRDLLAPTALIAEKISPKEALARSKQMSKAHRGVAAGSDMTLGMTIVIGFLGLIFSGSLAILYQMLPIYAILERLMGDSPLAEVWRNFIGGIPFFAVFAFLFPMWCVSSSVSYFERRIRAEGYDIHLMNNELPSKNRR